MLEESFLRYSDLLAEIQKKQSVLTNIKAKTAEGAGKEFEYNLWKYVFGPGCFRRFQGDFPVNIQRFLDKNKEDFASKGGLEELIDNNIFLRGKLVDHGVICQPYGSHQFPDYLLLTPQKIIPLEAKTVSSNTGAPVWNGSPPKRNCLYVFGSSKRREVTFFTGHDTIREEVRRMVLRHFQEAKDLKNKQKQEYNELCELFGYNILDDYLCCAEIRLACTDRSGCYFRKKRRREVEERAFSYLANNSTAENRKVA